MDNTEPLQVSVEPAPAVEDVRAVRQGLDQFNLHHAGEDGYRPLYAFVRDASGAIHGGLLGETYWGWLHVSILWLEADARGRGYGSQLLAAAEAEAKRRGCRHAHLDTLSFQALPFYEARGYTLFGTLDDLPPGHQRFFLQKAL